MGTVAAIIGLWLVLTGIAHIVTWKVRGYGFIGFLPGGNKPKPSYPPYTPGGGSGGSGSGGGSGKERPE